MSEKKEAKKEKAAKPAPAAKPAKKAKIDRMTKVKRGPDGKKIMNVARGTARSVRREGLKQGWRNVANAKQMAPPATVVN